MALFLSTTINKIDKKGRVSVPAAFRNSLASEDNPHIVVFRSLKLPILEGCSYERMMQLSQHHDSLNFSPHIPEDYQSLIFAESQLLTFDAEGRVSIPPQLMEHASITDSIAFVGRGATFELWDPKKFQEHHDAVRQKLQLQIGASHG